MEHFLIALCVALPLVLGVFEFSSYMTYGGFIKSDAVIKAINHHLPNGVDVNQFDTDIITIGKMPYISTTKSVLGYYYIDGVGRVWTFSKAHTMISMIHKAAVDEYNKQNPSKTIEQKLNIK
jgi:hypothetical protein